MSGEPTPDRQVPFYCPYCGEEDLVPDGPEGGAWRCRSCARAFALRSLGVAERVGAERVGEREDA